MTRKKSGVKFEVEFAADTKPMKAEVRKALQQIANLIKSDRNYITAASKEAFTKAGKAAAKAFYAGFNSIKPGFKTQTPTATAGRSTSSRSTSVSTPISNLPTELPPAQVRAAYTRLLADVKRREEFSRRLMGLRRQEIESELALAAATEKAAIDRINAEKKVEATLNAALTKEIALRQKAADTAKIAAVQAEINARKVEAAQNKILQAAYKTQMANARVLAQNRGASAQASVNALRNPVQQPNALGVLSNRINAGAAGAVSKLQSSFQGLMNVGAAVNGVLFKMAGIVAIVTGAILALNAAVQKAMEFTQAQFALAVAIRASQRLYGEQIGTINEWTEAIERLRVKYGVFTQTELTQGVAQLIATTRQFAFNKEQVDALSESVAILAEMNGRTFADAADQAVSLLQGNSRALESFSVDASEAAFAQQAVIDGHKESYEVMSLQEKAQVRLNYLLRQTAPLAEDAAKAQGTMTGRVQKANAAFTTFATKLGAIFQPIFVTLMERMGQFVGSLGPHLDTIALFVANFVGLFVSLKTGVELALQGVRIALEFTLIGYKIALGKMTEADNERITALVAQMHALAEGFSQLPAIAARSREQFMEEYRGLLKDFEDAQQSLTPPDAELMERQQAIEDALLEGARALDDAFRERNQALDDLNASYFEDRAELARESAEREVEAARDYGERLADLDRDLAESRLDAARDYGEELADIERETAEDRLEAERDFAEKLVDIERDAQERREDIARDYAQNLADLARDVASRRAEIEEDYARKVSEQETDYQAERERDEEDHQKNLQRIREKYAIDIDEAVQKRDARAILNLQRRRAQELSEAQDDFATRQKREAEDQQKRRDKERKDYEERLADLEKSEQEKRDEINRSHAEQLADLERNLDRQRQEAQRDYQQRLQDLERAAAQQRAAAQRDYDQKLADLQRANTRARQEAARDYAQQLADIRKNTQQQEAELRASYARRYADIERAHRERLIAISRQWADEGRMNEAGARYIWTVLSGYFNVGGYIDQLMQAFAGRYNLAIQVQAQYGATTPMAPQPSGGGNASPSVPMAQGGFMMANRPTNILMGEAGREAALFLPLNSAFVQNNFGGGGVGRDVNLRMDLHVTGETDFLTLQFADAVADVVGGTIIEALR